MEKRRSWFEYYSSGWLNRKSQFTVIFLLTLLFTPSSSPCILVSTFAFASTEALSGGKASKTILWAEKDNCSHNFVDFCPIITGSSTCIVPKTWEILLGWQNADTEFFLWYHINEYRDAIWNRLSNKRYQANSYRSIFHGWIVQMWMNFLSDILIGK